MKLSIIIPVFKVEAYITECIQSIIGTEGDYEVILVNDGTPDRSMEMAASMVAGRKNVRVVNQENQGLSAARMNGLKEASGEYVWFVDKLPLNRYIGGFLCRRSPSLAALRQILFFSFRY